MRAVGPFGREKKRANYWHARRRDARIEDASGTAALPLHIRPTSPQERQVKYAEQKGAAGRRQLALALAKFDVRRSLTACTDACWRGWHLRCHSSSPQVSGLLLWPLLPTAHLSRIKIARNPSQITNSLATHCTEHYVCLSFLVCFLSYGIHAGTPIRPTRVCRGSRHIKQLLVHRHAGTYKHREKFK